MSTLNFTFCIVSPDITRSKEVFNLFQSFHNVLNSYTWTKRMQEYSVFAHSLLRDNQLKRTGPSTGSSYILKSYKFKVCYL